MKNHLIKLICLVLLITAVYLLLKHFGITENLSRDNIPKLKAEISNFGGFAPLVYIGFLCAGDQLLPARFAGYHALRIGIWAPLGCRLCFYRIGNWHFVRFSYCTLCCPRHG